MIETKPYHITIEIHELPKTINAQTSLHWRDKGKLTKHWHKWVAFLIGAQKPKWPLKKAKLTCIRFSSVAPDYDGLVSSFKAVIDGLVNCGVLEDDKMENIGMPEFLWKHAPRNQGKIEVTVTEMV